VTVSDAGGAIAALALKADERRQDCSQPMRIAKLQDLTGMFATVNGFSAIVATTVMPHIRQLGSILVSRDSDWGDEAVAASGDVDDEAIPILTVTQRATQR